MESLWPISIDSVDHTAVAMLFFVAVLFWQDVMIQLLSLDHYISVSTEKRYFAVEVVIDLSCDVCAQVSAMITITHERRGWSIRNSAEMTVSTPFDGYRLSKWRWSHENAPDKWKCHHELDFRSQQFVVDIDANHRVTSALRRLSANITFQTPANIASWLQNVSGLVDYQHDMRAWRSSGRTNFRWGRYTFGHEHEVNIEPYTAVVTTAKLTTPFPGFHQLGIEFNNRKAGNVWRANNEVLLGSIGKVSLDGSLDYNGYDFNSMIRITTPIHHIERIVASVRNLQQRDGIWVSHANIQYNSDKTMSIDSKLNLGSQKTVELEATTPFSLLHHMKYKAGYSGNWRSFQASADLQHNMRESEQITAMILVDANNLHNMNGQLMIRTPFEALSSLRVTARHIQDSYEHAVTNVSWQLNQYQGSCLHDVTAPSWADFDSRCELEYLNNRKIVLTSSFHLNPKIVVVATLQSPFEHARHVSFSLNQDGPLDNFKIISELLYGNNKKISTNLEFAVRNDSLRTFVRLMTPFNAVDRFTFEVNLSGRPTQFSLQSAIELNNHKLTKTLEFQLRQKTLAIRGNLRTPFRRIRSFTYAISHNGDLRSFHSNLVVTYNGQELTGSCEYGEYGSHGSNMTFELQTPWTAFRSCNFQHSRKPGNSFAGWKNSWSVESNGQRLTGGDECNWDGNQLDVYYTYNAPEEYSIRLSHTGSSASHFSNNIVIKLADNQITEAMQFRRTTDRIDVQLNVASTFHGYERMEAAFKHELSDNGFTTTASISTPLQVFPRMSTMLTYERSENRFSSQVRAQLPFEAVERFVVSLNYRGNPADFRSSLMVSVNDMSATSTLRHRGLSPTDFATSLSVDYGGKKIELEMRLARTAQMNYEGNFRVVTPCPYVRDVSVTISHNCNPHIKAGALKIILNGDEKVSTVTLYVSICAVTFKFGGGGNLSKSWSYMIFIRLAVIASETREM